MQERIYCTITSSAFVGWILWRCIQTANWSQEVENIIIVQEGHIEIQQQLVTDLHDTEPASTEESDDLPDLIHSPRDQRQEVLIEATVEESANVLGNVI